jgi:hypothetical protein
MCNIAGYVGSRRAAPIILEMLRREEGFAGGFYSGLAAATYEGAGEAALGNVRYSEIYADKLTAINKKLGKLP